MRPIRYIERLPRIWYLAILMIIGSVLRFWDIAKSSIWHDEGFTMMIIQFSPQEIIGRTARDVHPPLYYEALHFWTSIFGLSEAAARSMSLACMVLAIPVAYALVRRLFGESSGRLAALFVTLGPFAIRYAQEARMYAMVAFLLLLATYLLVAAIAERRWRWWAAYGVCLSAALYTHYFSVFVILIHGLYMLVQTKPGRGLRDQRFWAALGLALLLFLPWLPMAFQQFTRVQAAFWILPIGANTLPNTVFQFLAFSNGDFLTLAGECIVASAIVTLIVANIFLMKRHRHAMILLSSYALLGPLLIALLSLRRPIYVDRYFVFAAVAFYCVLAPLIILGWPLRTSKLGQTATIALVIILSIAGIHNIHVQTDHQMRQIGIAVSEHIQPGDEVVAASIYTYFDFSYYNHTGRQLRLYYPGGVDGYAESSLIYDRSAEIVVEHFNDLQPRSGYVWVVAKTQPDNDFRNVPSNWMPVGQHYAADGSEAQRYRIPTSPIAQK